MYKQKGHIMERKYIISEHQSYTSIKNQLLVDVAFINDDGKLIFIGKPTDEAKSDLITFLDSENISFSL